MHTWCRMVLYGLVWYGVINGVVWQAIRTVDHFAAPFPLPDPPPLSTQRSNNQPSNYYGMPQCTPASTILVPPSSPP